MQRTMILIAALALGTTPALAQDTATDANADVAVTNTVDANSVAVNDVAAIPVGNADVAMAPEAAAPAPAPAPAPRERGFPWGVIGLVGLIGLLGRRRRD